MPHGRNNNYEHSGHERPSVIRPFILPASVELALNVQTVALRSQTRIMKKNVIFNFCTPSDSYNCKNLVSLHRVKFYLLYGLTLFIVS